MGIITKQAAGPAAAAACYGPLRNGDQMTQEEFHLAYAAAPPGIKAELIGGTVFVASPLSLPHGRIHGLLTMIFGLYSADSPGVEFADNTTIILGRYSEPQPDLLMRVLPQCGGQSTTDHDDYVMGAPELVAEVSHSTRALDLHGKQLDYARHGVREYLVILVHEQTAHWFDLAGHRELPLPPDGICRIRQFPGLWIDPGALFAHDYQRLTDAVYHGIHSQDHAQFVQGLADARNGRN